MLALANVPYRIWYSWEIPKSYVPRLGSSDDMWIKRDGVFYNLNEFCTVGAPRIPGPMGGAQTAIGEFMIAAAGDGKLYAVVDK